jgi:hypothetical protein
VAQSVPAVAHSIANVCAPEANVLQYVIAHGCQVPRVAPMRTSAAIAVAIHTPIQLTPLEKRVARAFHPNAPSAVCSLAWLSSAGMSATTRPAGENGAGAAGLYSIEVP